MVVKEVMKQEKKEMDRKSEFGTGWAKISISFKTFIISTPPGAYVTVKKNPPFSLNDIENIRPFFNLRKTRKIYKREMYYMFVHSPVFYLIYIKFAFSYCIICLQP